jgi:hypothetical protein
VIHLAFGYPSGLAAALPIDLRAVETMGAVLEGSGKPFVTTSHLGGEASDNAVLSLAGARGVVVSLSLSIHGEGDIHGFVPRLSVEKSKIGEVFPDRLLLDYPYIANTCNLQVNYGDIPY